MRTGAATGGKAFCEQCGAKLAVPPPLPFAHTASALEEVAADDGKAQ